MKVVFIGADARPAQMAALSVRPAQPDVTPLVAPTASDGLEVVAQESPDVVLVHPDFVDMSLPKFIQELRRFSNVPLMVLSSHGDEMEVVTALELGADDYVRFPCDLTEMMARIWALLRRVGNGTSQESETPLLSGRLLINPSTYEVFMGGQRVTLTSTEFRLLYLLAKNRGCVVHRQTMEQALCGDQVDGSGIVKKYVERLRQKLGDDAHEPRWIACIHGVGYRFIGPSSESQETPMADLVPSR